MLGTVSLGYNVTLNKLYTGPLGVGALGLIHMDTENAVAPLFMGRPPSPARVKSVAEVDAISVMDV